MVKDDLIHFSLQDIKNEQFAILEKNHNDKKPVELNTSILFKLDSKKHLIGAFVGITFEQTKKAFLIIEVSCHFKIEDVSWKKFVNKEGASVTIPKGFLAHIASITVGTLRGVLFTKTEGTPLNKFIVPTLNVEQMIKEDAVFPI